MFAVPRPTLINVSGPDAERTLHSLLSQEVRRMPVGWVTRTAVTDRRGRLLGLFRVHAWREGETLLEGGPGLEGVLDHLAPFLRLTETEAEVIAGRVEIEPDGSAEDGGEWDGEAWVARLAAPESSLVRVIPGGDPEGDRVAWDSWRAERGIPAMGVDLEPGKALPAEGGLDGTHVSFDKGCFPGQEVILRLRNFGDVRRRLAVVSGEAEAGAELTAAGAPAGTVTTWDPAAGRGLAMVSAHLAEAGAVLEWGGGSLEVAGPAGG